jgi:hypothetical protein
MLFSTKGQVRDALITAALFGSTALFTTMGTALAQAPAQAPAAKADQDSADQPSSKPDQNATQEPSAKTAPANTPDSGVFVNGTLSVPGAATDTSTTPAKFSQRNDARDHIPIMARGPKLSDAQRKLILASVKASPSPPANVATGPAMELPLGDQMQAWPQDILSQVPDLRDTKYVKLADKVLVVIPDSRIVVEEIAQ